MNERAQEEKRDGDSILGDTVRLTLSKDATFWTQVPYFRSNETIELNKYNTKY